MPRILPSQVVARIQATYANLDNPQLRLNYTGIPQVASLLRLVEAVGEEHYDTLSGDDYILFSQALAEIQSRLGQWTHGDQTAYRQTGGPVIGPSEALGNRNPFAVVRDLLAKCPDSPHAAAASTLAELETRAPQLAVVLREDIGTALTALGNAEFKAACVLAGSVMEALLMWAVEAADKGGSLKTTATAVGVKKDIEWWSLSDFAAVAEKMAAKSGAPLIDAKLKALLVEARDFRNLIHPGAVRRLEIRPDIGFAHVSIGAMWKTVDRVEALIKDGEV